MADYTKTAARTLIAHQAVTHPGFVLGSEVDVSALIAAGIFLYHGYTEAVANTNPGTFYIQGSPLAAGDDEWMDIVSFTANTDTPADETLGGTEAIGSKSMGVAATAGFTAGDLIYIHDVGTEADSEWHRVQEIITNTSIELIDGLEVAKDVSDHIYGSAQAWFHMLDLAPLMRVRCLFMHEGTTGANVAIMAKMSTADAIE